MTMAENNLNKAIVGPVDLDQEIREKGFILANNLGRIK